MPVQISDFGKPDGGPAEPDAHPLQAAADGRVTVRVAGQVPGEVSPAKSLGRHYGQERDRRGLRDLRPGSRSSECLGGGPGRPASRIHRPGPLHRLQAPGMLDQPRRAHFQFVPDESPKATRLRQVWASKCWQRPTQPRADITIIRLVAAADGKEVPGAVKGVIAFHARHFFPRRFRGVIQ